MSNKIHETSKISSQADLEQSSRGSQIIIGKNSMVDAFVKMKFAGGSANIEIGDQCYINSGCVLYSGGGIKMGNKVLIAANCTFAPVNHGTYLGQAMLEQDFKESRGGIVIGDDVWIGANCVLLDGAIIPNGTIIAAGSVVNKELTIGNAIYTGIPAKFLKLRPTKPTT